jgi:hypothetical protein
MDPKFEEFMATISDEELSNYFKEYDRYTVEAINAAMEEQQRRGKYFTNEELKNIHKNLREKIDAKSRDTNICEGSIDYAPWKFWRLHFWVAMCLGLLLLAFYKTLL